MKKAHCVRACCVQTVFASFRPACTPLMLPPGFAASAALAVPPAGPPVRRRRRAEGGLASGALHQQMPSERAAGDGQGHAPWTKRSSAGACTSGLPLAGAAAACSRGGSVPSRTLRSSPAQPASPSPLRLLAGRLSCAWRRPGPAASSGCRRWQTQPFLAQRLSSERRNLGDAERIFGACMVLSALDSPSWPSAEARIDAGEEFLSAEIAAQSAARARPHPRRPSPGRPALNPRPSRRSLATYY